MICPYFRTGRAGAISATATLCPSAIGSRTATDRAPSSSANPAGIGRVATATLSSSRSKTARRASVAVAIGRSLASVLQAASTALADSV